MQPGFQAKPAVAACDVPWLGCRQGIEVGGIRMANKHRPQPWQVMCLKDGRWRMRDWIHGRPGPFLDLTHGSRPDLEGAKASVASGCCPEALLTLPGVHQERAGLLRLSLLLGDYASQLLRSPRQVDLDSRTHPGGQ